MPPATTTTMTSLIPPAFTPFTSAADTPDPQPPAHLFPYPIAPCPPNNTTDPFSDWGACPPTAFNHCTSHNPTRTTKGYFKTMLGIFADTSRHHTGEGSGSLDWLAVSKLAVYTSTELTLRHQAHPDTPDTPPTWRHISFHLLNNWILALHSHRAAIDTHDTLSLSPLAPLLHAQFIESVQAFKSFAHNLGYAWQTQHQGGGINAPATTTPPTLSGGEAAALWRVAQRMLVARLGGVLRPVEPEVVLFLVWRMYLYTMENVRNMGGKKGKGKGKGKGKAMGEGDGKGEKGKGRVPLGGISGNGNIIPAAATTATATPTPTSPGQKIRAGKGSSEPAAAAAVAKLTTPPPPSITHLTTSISRHLHLDSPNPAHTYPLTIYTLLNGNHTKYKTLRHLTTSTPYTDLLPTFTRTLLLTEIVEFAVGRLCKDQPGAAGTAGMLHRSLKKGWGVSVMPTVTAEEDWREFIEEWVAGGEGEGGDLLGGSVLLVVDVRGWGCH